MSAQVAPGPPDVALRALVNRFRHDLVGRVFAGSEQHELLASVQALDRWLEDAIAAFAQAFVAASEQVIAHRQRAIGSVASARMMGAEVIISGLSAEISQTLGTVGIDLGRVSAGDLQGGIELAEAQLSGR